MVEIAGSRVIVTGGAGFIGSHLVDALEAAGAIRIAVVDNFFLGAERNLAESRSKRPELIQLYREDAADADAMRAVCKAEKPDLVFNLATKALLYSFFNPAGACRVNVDIALCFAELLREGFFRRLIHVSSSEVYGNALYVPMDERHPLMAETTYAAGKAGADLALAAYEKMFNLDIVIVRPFNNYGPRQNDAALAAIVPLTIKRLRAGAEPVIEGDGSQTRDFIYVEDTVRALLRLAEIHDTRGQIMNVGSGEETSIRQIVDRLCGIYDYTGPITYRPSRPADVVRHCADVGGVESFIGPVAVTPLQDGLVQTARWYDARAVE